MAGHLPKFFTLHSGDPGICGRRLWFPPLEVSQGQGSIFVEFLETIVLEDITRGLNAEEA